MSRLKNFTRSLLSGYAALAANIVYTLASVPLALHYLNKEPFGKEEFGLWALVSQLGSYITLIEIGMSGSVSRILIDHKDERHNGVYGSVIKISALVGSLQGLLIISLGILISMLAGPLLKVPVELRQEFFWLMAGQSVLLGVSFTTKVFSQILFAHQRLDIGNYSSIFFFFLSVAVMWAGFAGGFGVYSFLPGQAVIVLGSGIISISGCMRLGFLPQPGEWGKVTGARFRELFAYGRGVFLISVGGQIINTSQTILLTRLLGLEAAATWNICTRTYNMMTMLVWRILDYSAPGLSEMCARKEYGKLQNRIRDILVLMAGLSLVGGTIFAVANGPFVAVWSLGKFSWPPINNILLGLWFIGCSIMRVYNGLIGVTKDLHFLRYIYLVEGSVFIGLNLLAYRMESMTLMLLLSLVSTLTFTLPYGMWRTRKYFKIGWPELLGWLYPAWRLAWRLIPVALATWWLTQKLPARWQLALNIGLTGIWGLALLLRYGLPQPLLLELAVKLPESIQPIFKRCIRA